MHYNDFATKCEKKILKNLQISMLYNDIYNIYIYI